ncbi:MAG: CYTH and CHAD domain-containing protein [Mycobacteriaceae bacterium]
MRVEAVGAASVREVERKYVLPEGGELPDLTGVEGVASVTGPDWSTLDATYFDAGDLRLLRAGITLRRRTGGVDAGWHLKLPEDTDARTEMRLPLDAGVDTPPDELAALVSARMRGAALLARARITTSRERRVLCAEGGGVLAEVVVDTVHGARLTPEAGKGEGETQDWREIEVEWSPDGEGVAAAVEDRLRRAGIGRAAHPSKLARVLGDDLGDRPTGEVVAGRRASVGVLLSAYLREQMNAIVDGDLAFRRDQSEAVHNIRVGARRARSALVAFAPLVDVPAAGMDVVEELRWLGTELGAARDVEVQRERIVTRLGTLAPALIVGPVHGRVEAFFAARADLAGGRALTAVNSARYLQLLESVDGIVDGLAASGGAPGCVVPARKVVPQVLDRMGRTVTKRVRGVARTAPGSERDVAVHRTRKAAKRMRYAIEAARPLARADTKRTLARFAALQDALGDHQDSIVAQQHLLELEEDAQRSGESGFSYGVMYQRELDIAAERVSQLPEVWKRADRASRVLRRR